MDEEDLHRLLAGALDAQARRAVGDGAAPPPPRFAQPGAGQGAHAHGRRLVRWFAPLAAAAAVVAVVLGVPALTDKDTHRPARTGAAAPRRPQVSTSAPAPAPAPTPAQPVATSVRVSLLNVDGRSYGVGMPVVAYFSRKFGNARAFAAATSVTVNGKPVRGAWYFERSAAGHGPIEGHYRLSTYWPAHAKVQVSIAARGRPAGAGLTFGNDLDLDFATGPRTVSTVDDTSHQLVVTSDGKKIGVYPVSLGAAQTPTSSGVKVIMAKGSSVCMSGPGYAQCGVRYTQRLTYGGEYLHAAPWNAQHIKAGIDSSNGCTNLLTGDARKLYSELEVGDVVDYPNADGPAMTMSAGYGDWNVPWKVWRTGGLVPTH
jgi:lipoprotein-anchoring transpeptidase ErfK/SrfK